MAKDETVIDLLRRKRGVGIPLLHAAQGLPANIPVPKFNFLRVIIGLVIVAWGLNKLFEILKWNVPNRTVEAISFVLVVLLTCYPLVYWLFISVKQRRLRADYFVRFPELAQFWYSVVMCWLLFGISESLYPPIFKSLGAWKFLLVFAVAFCLNVFLKIKSQLPVVPRAASRDGDNKRFGLFLGTSTGKLGEFSHGAALRAAQNVSLSLQDAAQNILVLGGIGSGKTTRAVQPLLVQLLDQDSGGIIFDIKGDFKEAVSEIAQAVDREITLIGPERTKMNLIKNLSPEVAASFLKSALLLNGRGNSDPFWIDTASELCKNALGVLSFFPARYSLSDLHEYLFDPAIREGLNDEARDMQETLPDREFRLLRSYLSYYDIIFAGFDDKVKKGVEASVSQILSPFNHPDLVDAFCNDSEDAPLMEKVLDGTVYLVDMPLSRWGLGGKVAYNFIKLRFFNVMQKRNSESEWNKERPVFFMCDEFQEIVSANRDGLSDLNFWDKSRSSKCIGIISAQAVSSFYAAIGNRDISDALLQNFRQKICFRTEDSHTIEKINALLGSVEVERVSHQQSSGTSTGGIFSHHSSTNEGSSYSTSRVEKRVLNPQIFRTLGNNQAIALLSFGGASADDVIETVPVFTSGV